jgi:hypothetical protein
MDIDGLLKEKRDEILGIAARHGVRNVRVFGSVARGDACPESDVDFLIELEDGRSLLDISCFWQEIEDLLGCDVDVVESEGLHWYIKDRVLSEAMPL